MCPAAGRICGRGALDPDGFHSGKHEHGRLKSLRECPYARLASSIPVSVTGWFRRQRRSISAWIEQPTSSMLAECEHRECWADRL